MYFERETWDAYFDTDHFRMAKTFNAPLYRAFEETHQQLTQDKATAWAMILLLDKSYSAALGRITPLRKLVDDIFENQSKRKQFSDLVTVPFSTGSYLTEASLGDVARRVDDFADCLKTWGGSKRPLSFASKFLHFRLGVVPIWDKFARRGLSAIDGGGVPSTYGRYVIRFYRLLKYIHGKEAFTASEVRNLDSYLLGGSFYEPSDATPDE